MPSLTETTTIPSPPDRVWPLLRDPALVASCIPGATLAPDQGDGLWRGSVRVKFGPTVAVFRGEASLVFDDAARTCTIEGRGIDGRGAARALLAEFSANMARKVVEQSPPIPPVEVAPLAAPPPAAAPSPPPAAAEI